MMFWNVRERILCHTPLSPMRILTCCEYPDGLASPYHTGAAFQTILVISGKAFFQEEGLDERACPPGMTVVLPAGCSYRWRMEGETLMYQCGHAAFSFKEHRELATLFGHGMKSLAIVDLGEDVAREFKRRFDAIMVGGSKAVNILLSVATLDLLSRILERSDEAPGPIQVEHPLLANAIRYMERNLHREMSLKELSKHSCLGSSRLSQLFRERMGTSPMQYMARLRANKAMELLLARQLTISEVACEMGFTSVNYFSRFFKRQTGISPLAAKNRNIV